MGRRLVLHTCLAIACLAVACLAVASTAGTAASVGRGRLAGEDARTAARRRVPEPETPTELVAHLPSLRLRGRSHSDPDRGRCPSDAEDCVPFDEQWKQVFQDLEFGSVVQTVVFPEDWLDGIASSGPRSLLDTKRIESVSWDAVELEEVTRHLEGLTGLEITLWPTARIVAGDEVEISLDLEDVTVRTVLDFVTEPYGLGWDEVDGTVRITTKPEARGGPSVRYLDVKDLIDPVREMEILTGAPPDASLLLLAVLRDSVRGASRSDDSAVLDIRNRILIVRSAASTHEDVEQQVDRIRARGGLLAALEGHRWGTVSGAPPRPLER